MTDVSQEEDKKGIKKISLRYCTEQCNICGSRLLRLNKSRHNRTKKHMDAKYLWHDMLEITEFLAD